MSGLFSFIIMICIVSSILRKAKRADAQLHKKNDAAQELLKRMEQAQTSSGGFAAQQYNRQTANRNVQTVSRNEPIAMSEISNPAIPLPSSEVPNTRKPVQSQGKPATTQKPSQPAKAEKVEIVQKEGESTTEFLHRKAAADQIEHRKEALEQKREEAKAYGNLHYAYRWMEGDPIPAGMRMIKCGYCGAENLVKPHGGKYNCYFCREEI